MLAISHQARELIGCVSIAADFVDVVVESLGVLYIIQSDVRREVT